MASLISELTWVFLGADFARNPTICESRCSSLFPTDLASVETWFADYRTRNGHLAPADPVSVVPRFDNLVEFPNRRSPGMKPDGAERQTMVFAVVPKPAVHRREAGLGRPEARSVSFLVCIPSIWCSADRQ